MKTKTCIALTILTGMAWLHAGAGVNVSTVVGPGSLAEPYGCAEDTNGNIYISDSANSRIVRIDALTAAATVLAGVSGVQGSSDGPTNGTSPGTFSDPQGLLAVNLRGTNGLLVTDSATGTTGTNLIRFVRFSDGYVTTLAGQAGVSHGTTNEIGVQATFGEPLGMDQDTNGNVYIVDLIQNSIRVMNLQDPAFGITNLVLTDGTVFHHPKAVACVGGNQLWVADSGNNAVDLITLATPTSGSLTTRVGSRTAGSVDAPAGSAARFNNPSALCWLSGTGLLISDTGNDTIRLATFSPVGGVTNFAVTTYAGISGSAGAADGTNSVATFSGPEGLCLDPANTAVLLADLNNSILRRLQYGPPRPLTPSNLVASASLGMVNLTWTASANSTSYNIKRSPTSGGPYAVVGVSVTTVFSDTNVQNGETYYYVVSGTNSATEGANSAEASATTPQLAFSGVDGLAYDSANNYLYSANESNNTIQRLNLNNNTTAAFLTVTNGLAKPVAVWTDTNANVYVLNQGNGSGYLLEFDKYGNAYGTIATNLSQPTALVQDGYGVFFIAQQSGAVLAFGAGVSNLVVNVSNATTNLNVSLQGIALFDDGTLAVSDAGDEVIWAINPITKETTVLTGKLGMSGLAVGAANFAQLNQPHQLMRVGGNQLVGADTGNNRLVLVQRTGMVTTNLNGGSAALWYGMVGDPVGTNSINFVAPTAPVGVALGAGGEVFDSEPVYAEIRGLTGAGLSAPTSNPGVSQPAFSGLDGMAYDSADNYLYSANAGNNTIQRLNLNNNATAVFLSASNGLINPVAVWVDTNANVYVLNQGGGNGFLLEFDKYGSAYGTIVTNLSQPTALVQDGYGVFFIAQQSGAVLAFGAGVSNLVVNVTNATTNVNVSLQGIALFDDGTLAVSDAGNDVIWGINPITKVVSLLTGQPGVSGAAVGADGIARLSLPHQLLRVGGDQIVGADTGNNRLVLVQRTGSVTTNLNGSGATLWYGAVGDPVGASSVDFVPQTAPVGVALGSGGEVFDSEPVHSEIRGFTSTGVSTPTSNPGVSQQVFSGLDGLAYDSANNYLYSANESNNTIQRLNLNNNTTAAFLTVTNGLAKPVAVWTDTNANVYVLNQGNGSGYLLEFDKYGNAYGTIVTNLSQPTALVQDGYGVFFIAQQSGAVLAFGAGVSNVVVNVSNATTNLNVSLQGIALFDDGTLVVSDAGDEVIWAINPITKETTVLTGKLGMSGPAVGAANFAQLNQPHQLMRVGGNQLVGADTGNNRLVLVQRTGMVTTNWNGGSAALWYGMVGDPVGTNSIDFVAQTAPVGVALGAGGEVFDSEPVYAEIRGLTGSGLNVPTSNPGVFLPSYSAPAGIALNTTGTILYVTDPTNNTISTLDLANNATTVFLSASNGLNRPVDVGVDIDNNVYVLNQGDGGNGSVLKYDLYGNLLATNASSLPLPTAMQVDVYGSLYVCELNGLVQQFTSTSSNTLANITTNGSVRLQGIAVLDNGTIVVSDTGNQVIWQIPAGGTNAVLFTGVMGVSGKDFGAVGFAKLNQPMGLAQASSGLLLIADSGNNRVVVANDAGTISAVLNSTNAELWFGLPIDPVASSGVNFVPMLSPVKLAIGGSSGTVYDSESVYKVVRGMLSTGITVPTVPPAAPQNLVATAGYGQIALTWSAATGATNYAVLRTTSTNTSSFVTIASTTATSYTDTKAMGGSTYYYVVVAANAGGAGPASGIASGTALIPPPPAPEIGWFDYEEDFLYQFVTVMYPVSVATFHNDTLLAINPDTNGVSTYFIAGAPPLSGSPSVTNGSVPPTYADGWLYAVPLPSFGLSNVVIEAVNVDSVGQSSPITTAQFIFQVANPSIGGFNGAQFLVSDITTNAMLYYTVDGSDPYPFNATNAANTTGPVVLNETNTAQISIEMTSNVLFKVMAVRDGYLSSGIARQTFSSSNYVANSISFGFASGEASSAFIAAPGQTFYAPVTMSTLSGAVMYSLQFNITVTNAGLNPGPSITPGAFGFKSMLMKPDGVLAGQYDVIPPYMFAGLDSSEVDPSQIVEYLGTNYVNLVTTNTAINLLGVGWVERYGQTNLYPTIAQDLIKYSVAHDDLFPESKQQIIVGGYEFQVPSTATSNQTYQIQIGRPSATADGVGAPGSSVYIVAPTNGATGSGSPINALKYVTVGQIPYLVGSVYPFRWFNAGDFGSSNIVNADVEQVFEAAVNYEDMPPGGSDFFDSMDSCGGTYVDLGSGYLEFNSYVSGPNATNPLFDGDDTSINQIAFGDGVLDVCDVYVTFRRSLDPSLDWFQRYWNNGKRVARIVVNGTGSPKVRQSSARVQTKVVSATTNSPQVSFFAADVSGTASQTVQVPIDAAILGGYPLRLLMLALTVTPLDGSPNLTAPVGFAQAASTLGSPYITSATGNNKVAAVWLDNTNAGLTGLATLGTLTVTLPATADSSAAYAVHFDHASASPNGVASFPKQTLTGLITLSSRTNSYYNDGIPDSWRLRWFGTIYNALSQSNACPSGDGVPNWKKYVAGVDPNTANNFPSTTAKVSAAAATSTAIQWPSVYGKQYVIMRASSLYASPWTVLSTNTGTGGTMEFDDANAATAKFYRVEILP